MLSLGGPLNYLAKPMGPFGVINVFLRTQCPNFVRGPPSRVYMDRTPIHIHPRGSLESSGRLTLEKIRGPSEGFFLRREYRGVTIGSFVTPVTPVNFTFFPTPLGLFYLPYRFPWDPLTYSHGPHRPSDPDLVGAFELPCKTHGPP